MPHTYQIKKYVIFTEFSAVPKEFAENSNFDIYNDNGLTNESYCKVLMSKIFKLPYRLLPDFISHHTALVSDPIKWLNKLEKLVSENEELFFATENRGRMMKCYTIIESKRKELEPLRNRHRVAKPPMQYINAECEERYFSFRELKNKVNAMENYTEKIMLLTKERFSYEQASIDFINPKLPDYADQCQKEIDHIQHIIKLTEELAREQFHNFKTGLPYKKVKINTNINQFVDIFYQLHRELFIVGKPIIDGGINDMVAIIVNSFVDKDGRDLSPETVKTLLTPSKSDKRPKPHKRIDIDKLL